MCPEWPKTGGISCSFFCWIILSNELCLVPTPLMFDPVHTYSVMCLFISDDDRSIWKQLKNGLVKIYSSYSQIFVLTFHILNHHKICRWPKIYCKNNEKHVLSLAQLEAPKKNTSEFRALKSSLASLSPQKSTSFLTTSAVGIPPETYSK